MQIEIDSDKKSVTITTADGKEGVNVTNIQGGCMVVILGGMVSADEPQPEPQPEPQQLLSLYHQDAGADRPPPG